MFFKVIARSGPLATSLVGVLFPGKWTWIKGDDENRVFIVSGETIDPVDKARVIEWFTSSKVPFQEGDLLWYSFE